MTNKSNFQKDFAIGVFDSGIGGLTIAKSILEKLPSEQLIYFGDTLHLPYGDKSSDAIRYYSLKICKLLVEKNCKMIVVACNSASSAAYNVLLEFFQEKVLFVNVVDPLVNEAVKLAEKKVGVIATKATIRSGVYKTKLQLLRPNLEVVEMATPLFVPMIEEGFYENNISHEIIDTYLGNKKMEGIDTLLLACTHYPLIRKEIEAFYDHKVKVLDSTTVTANAVSRILNEATLLSTGNDVRHQFFVSDYTNSFLETTKLFFIEMVDLKELQIW